MKTRENRESHGGSGETTIKEFIPASWFHPVGIFKVLARFWDRLPDVSGKLFLTFTVDPKLYASEEAAFEDSRDWLRKVFFQLRQGVEHEGKTYSIDAPYCIKVEFHESGWVHYHAIFLTPRFLPKELLSELWGLGWVKVQRITTTDFQYLLKYVTKPEDLPEWVKKRKRLRVFQTTKGFLKELPKDSPSEPKNVLDEFNPKKKRASYTIDERFWRWACMAVIRQNGQARAVRFQMPYRKLFDHLVLGAARDGRYKGSGEIVIDRKEGLGPWIKMQSQLLRARN
ncbi:MAG: hypothetical protein NTW03_11885 [Verrucomicrobia bacterium]|nr:hypothetical protein [Verrucomicrobiota bacterium]